MFWKKTPKSTATAGAASEAKADVSLTPNSTLNADSDEVPVAVNPNDPNFGTSTAIKTFYESRSKRHGTSWVTTPPKQLSEKTVKSNTRVAIKIFKVEDHEQPTISGRTPLKIESFEIQSFVLVAALKPILKEADMFVESTEPINFHEPFKPLFFSYDKIIDLNARTRTDGILKEHLNLLVGLMEELFGALRTRLKNLKASGLISYDLIWTCFPKGERLFSSSKDAEHVYRVSETQYKKCPHVFEILAEEIAFDGEKFAWVPTVKKIPIFPGNRPLVDLPHYPLSFHKNPEDVLKRLNRRAEKVIQYQELTYCEYAGVALEVAECLVRHNVNGRILVDYFGYSKYKQGVQIKYTTETDTSLNNVEIRNRPGIKNIKRTSRETDWKVDAKSDFTSDKTAFIQSISKEKQAENKMEMLGREDDLPYVAPYLKGYALKNKAWLIFFVDDIKPMAWNDDAYEHLVYPEGQKDLVLTFVDNHRRLNSHVDDVVLGKGQGLIMLLSGPPGTGKTLMAEAVADKTRRPLYYLQAEDLGTNATILGKKIKKVFEMATEWDAVILLDEADVFMAERDPGDIARNELVSIFLRELEYFQGTIFLTTNLYSTIDTAFRSRVDLHLLFSPLSFSSRLILWEKFLSRLDLPVVLEPKEREELGRWELNGREIKNIIKTARTWCVCKKYDIDLLRLESAIKVTAPQSAKVEVIGNGTSE